MAGRRATRERHALGRRDAPGFTLVEVLIALTIFGMIAGAGVALLAFSVRAQGASGAALDDAGAVNRLSAILTADLAQAQDRATRDRDGTLLPAFTGGAGDVPMLRLVRAGWSNVDAAPRADLQKVEYRLENGEIERVGYPALDGAAPLPPAVLLDRVNNVRLRFRFAGAWSDRWDGNVVAALPQVVELTATRQDGTAYRLLFLVGTGYPRPQVTNAPPA
jgi:general secretion pathway protein J